MNTYPPVAVALEDSPSLIGWLRRLTLSSRKSLGTLSVDVRAKERYRRALMTFVSSAFAKGVTVLTTAFSVPMALHYLGPERYGLWMAISSAITMLAFTDFGLGNGLLNSVASASGRGDRQSIRSNVSSAFFLLLGIAAVLSLAFTVVYPHLNWPRLFNVSSRQAAVEAGPTCAVFLVCFAASLPLGIVQKVQLGFQEGFRNNLWQAAGSVLSLVGLFAVINLRQGLPWLIAAVAGLPVLVMAANWITEFQWSRPWLIPQVRLFDGSIARSLAGRGSLFFLAQAGTALASQAPILLILRTFGPASVPEYAVAYRAITVLLLLDALLLSPLWPAYAEALSIRDVAWIRRTFFTTLKIVILISMTGALGFLLTYRRLIPLWVGPQVIPSAATAIGLSCFAVFNGLRYAASMCLNGCDRLLGQALYQVPSAVVGILLSIWLGPRFGVGGVAISFAVAEALVACLQLIEIHWFLKKLE